MYRRVALRRMRGSVCLMIPALWNSPMRNLSSRAVRLVSPLGSRASFGVQRPARKAWVGVFCRDGVRVSRTGRATAGAGGKANTGYLGVRFPMMCVDRTGDAEGGNARVEGPNRIL